MTPSVQPSISCRRNHSIPNSTAPLRISSTNGAPNDATTYQPTSSPNSGAVSSSRPSVLRIPATSVAIPAPHRNATTSALGGSGSRRSSASTTGTQMPSGTSASSSPTVNVPTPDSAASTRPTSRHRLATAIVTMTPTRARPGGRPSSTARGSSGTAAPAGPSGCGGCWGGGTAGPCGGKVTGGKATHPAGDAGRRPPGAPRGGRGSRRAAVGEWGYAATSYPERRPPRRRTVASSGTISSGGTTAPASTSTR